MKDSSVVQKGCFEARGFDGLANDKFSLGKGTSSSSMID